MCQTEAHAVGWPLIPSPRPGSRALVASIPMMLIPLSIWVGAEPYVLAAAVGAPAFLAWTLWHFRRSLDLSPTALRAHRTPRNR